MPDFTAVFTQERDHWQGRAETAEAEVERLRAEHDPGHCYHCPRCADADDSQQEVLRATISEILAENNRLDAELDRLRHRRIETVAELDALPDGAIVRSASSVAWQRSYGGWWPTSQTGGMRGSAIITLPALCIWSPEAQ